MLFEAGEGEIRRTTIFRRGIAAEHAHRENDVIRCGRGDRGRLARRDRHIRQMGGQRLRPLDRGRRCVDTQDARLTEVLFRERLGLFARGAAERQDGARLRAGRKSRESENLRIAVVAGIAGLLLRDSHRGRHPDRRAVLF